MMSEITDYSRTPANGAPALTPASHASSAGPASSATPSDAAASASTRSRARRAQEVICGALLALMAIWELAMIPVKPYLIGHPTLSSVITTDPVAEVALGVLAAYNHHRAMWLPPICFATALSTMKFHMVAFWAGGLWGHQVMQHGARTPKMKRFVGRLVRFTNRFPAVGVVVAYILIPFAPLIFAALGAGGVRWWKYLKLDLVCALICTAGYLYIGFALGKPAEHILRLYSHYSLIIAIVAAVALVALVIQRYVTRDARRIKAEEKARALEEAERRIAEHKAAKAQAKAVRRGAGQRKPL